MILTPHKVAVNIPVCGFRATVSIDGVPVRGLRAIKIESAMKDVTLVTLTFMADVTGEVEAVNVEAKPE